VDSFFQFAGEHPILTFFLAWMTVAGVCGALRAVMSPWACKGCAKVEDEDAAP
jgi:hypothetical protein